MFFEKKTLNKQNITLCKQNKYLMQTTAWLGSMLILASISCYLENLIFNTGDCIQLIIIDFPWKSLALPGQFQCIEYNQYTY